MHRSLTGRYGALTDQVVIADIVVDTFKLFDNVDFGEELQEQQGNKFAIDCRPTLADAHIVEIILTGFSSR